MKYKQLLASSYVMTPTATCANFTKHIKAAHTILQEEEIMRVSNMIFTLSSYIISLGMYLSIPPVTSGHIKCESPNDCGLFVEAKTGVVLIF